MLASPDLGRAIVFTKTKRGANRLSEKLERFGIQSTAIHGNKSQSARQKALVAFRDARIQVLVATDVAARGIDVEGVNMVVNYDIPHEPESYVHRIGRTGRAGASGVAVSLCAPDENSQLKAIERLIGEKVPVVKRPKAAAHRDDRKSGAETTNDRKPNAAKPKRRRRRRSTNRPQAV